MQDNQGVTEITGRPGKVFGNVFVPSSGSITVKIVGDTLQTTLRSGMEQTNSWVRIQNVDSVEIVESPEYLLLALGISLTLAGLGALAGSLLLGLLFLAGGIACIVYAFINKRRLLAIYSLRYTVPVFMTKPSPTYQQFAEHVMAIARHLNTPPSVPQTQRQQPTGKPSVNQANGQRAMVQSNNHHLKD